MVSKDGSSNVKVVVRVRPQSYRERLEMCEVCVDVQEDSNVLTLGTGSGKQFTFDKVCGTESRQDELYDLCCRSLVNGLFEGYNASLLAYGQTGSGKTYTMGTNFDLNIEGEELGIIPRALNQLYASIQDMVTQAEKEDLQKPEFQIFVQFMELYNEEVFDLLDSTTDKSRKSGIRIHEDAQGSIHVAGLKSHLVPSYEQAMHCLKEGTLARSTACTNMNVQSSRSHAVFTILLHQKRWKIVKDGDGGGSGDGVGDGGGGVGGKRNNDELDGIEDKGDSNETSRVVCEEVIGKFSLVDLAGSERLKRTQATGDRAKEAISINCGLLALGNVISALGDPVKIGCHVPYRDSKLTRILQDSLGGNSQTSMIACISPSDCDFMETLNSLNYANRTRNIKNRISANRGVVGESLVQSLKLQVADLSRQLQRFKQGNFDSLDLQSSDLVTENQMLLTENRELRERVKALMMTMDDVTNRNVQLIAAKEAGNYLEGLDQGKLMEVKEHMLPYIKEAEDLRCKYARAEKHLSNLSSPQSSSSPLSTSRSRNEVMSRSMISGSSQPLSQQFNRNGDLIDEVRSNIQQLNQLRIEKEGQKNKLESKDEDDDEDDGDDDEEDDVEEDDDENEDAGNLDKLEQDLNDLSGEINIKQRLLQELLFNQKSMLQLKVNYEEKITNLENKIKLTQAERDKIMANLAAKKSPSGDNSKNIKRDYEGRLDEMRGRLVVLKGEGRQHKKLMQAYKQQETTIHKLTSTLHELKQAKVTLMRRLQQDSKRNREGEQEMRKRVAQLQKQQRCKDIQLRKLQLEGGKKEVVLKRKIQEVEALKKRDQLRIKKRSQTGRKSLVSWEKFEKMIDTSVLKKQALLQLESDLEKHIKQREFIRLKLQERESEADDGRKDERKDELKDGLKDELKDELVGVVKEIRQVQQCIVQLEANKSKEIGSLISGLSAGDVVCCLERSVSLSIHKGVKLAEERQLGQDLKLRLEYQESQVLYHKAFIQEMIGQKVRYEVSHDVIIGGDDDDDVITSETFPKEGFHDQKTNDTINNSDNCNDNNNNNNDNNNNDNNTNNNNNNEIEEVIFDESSIDEDEHGFIEEADSEYSAGTNNNNNIKNNNNNNNNRNNNEYLVHMASCVGHLKAVLNVSCHGDKLFSCSKDASLKVWDVGEAKLIQSYNKHPGSVVMATYSPALATLYAATAYFVNVYDVRSSAATACLTSSGSVMKQSEMGSSSWSSCPAGEMVVKSLVLSSCGSLLYVAAGNCVRIWDNRMMRVLSKIQGKQQQAISCLALCDVTPQQSLLAAASKDCCIRYYNTNNGVHYVSTKSTTTPQQQHNDVVESLAFDANNTLYSCSRDKSLIRWEVGSGRCHVLDHAHLGWISGLTIHNPTSSPSLSSSHSLSSSPNNYVISACQNDVLKIWDGVTWTCLSQLDHVHAGGVNCVLSNQNLLFTASNDKTVGIWKFRNQEE